MSEPDKPTIIMIAYHFPPGEEIGGRRPFRLRKYLQRMGYKCHVITADEPAPDAPDDVIYVPDHLRRRWEGTTRGRLSWKGLIELLIRASLFPGKLGFVWSVDAAARCRQLIRTYPQRRFVIFSTYPPHGVLLAGLWVRLRERLPWVCDFRDPIADPPGLASRLTRLSNTLLERSSFRAATAVIANTEGAASVWRTRYPWAQSKLHVIWNGFDPEEAPKPEARPAGEQKLIVHAGELHVGRNPNLILESLSRLNAQERPEAKAVTILQVGQISPDSRLDSELAAKAQREGRLKLLPPVPKSEAQRMMLEADGLLLLQPNTTIQIPGKLFEYICIGRPILALTPRHSAVEWVLAQSGVPYVCMCSDDAPEVIDAKLVEFLRLPSTPVPYSDWYRNNFNAEHQAQQLAAIVESIE